MDDITIQKIKTSHPELRENLLKEYIEINNRLPKNVRLRFTYVYRSPSEQRELFLKRPKVTNADSYQSYHNFGLSFDFVILLDKNGDGKFETVSWVIDKHWLMVVDYFKSKGWSWGGDFKSFKDNPHFEKTYGLTTKVLKSRLDNGQTIKDTNGITYPKLK